MALIPMNSVGGYSTGLTMTAVIDALGNITGVTGSFTRTLTGTTASFTGLVSSTVGFSGSATNLVGNANGLTAGTASRVQIAEGAGSSYYLALAGGVGNTGIFVDTSAPRWNYNASTGALSTSTGYLEASTLNASTAIYSNTFAGADGTSPLCILSPYFDGTNQGIVIGDYNDAGNGTIFTLDDANTKIEISAVDVDCFANMNVKGGSDLRFYVPGGFTYIGFKSPLTPPNNIIWTLPSADGSSNQVLTTNGSGTLSWSTPSGGSSVTSFNGRTGAVQGVSAAVAGTGISVSGATGAVTITNIGVQSFNGRTGAVTGASLGANTFTELNTFNAGISAAGGVTLAGTLQGTTGSFSKLLSLSGGLSASGATFSAPITSTRMARHTSAVISAEKTANFSPTAAEDGTVFYINYGGKGSITVTLEGLPVGWRAKFFNIGGGMVFFTSTTGAVWGYGAANGLGDFMLEAICFSADNYIVG